eukprot:6214790-Pleurochrysis_carterae.AAC.1
MLVRVRERVREHVGGRAGAGVQRSVPAVVLACACARVIILCVRARVFERPPVRNVVQRLGRAPAQVDET